MASSYKTNRQNNRSTQKARGFSIEKKITIIFLISISMFFTAYMTNPYSYPPFDAKFMEDYPVHGVDVSSYQGDVDWNELYEQGVAFGLIKATEGSSLIDAYFNDNWDNIYRTPLRYGAYHFMSFETPGKTQAENYISTVEKRPGSLPPIVDVEYYAEFSSNPPSKETVDSILKPLLKELENHYGQEPIIYTNISFYNIYIKETYNNPIWIADLNGNDNLPDGKDWDFLQYSFEGELNGYSGAEKYIDLNVFNGSIQDLLKY